MTMFDWNRKDADPNDTIARIEKILNTINIPTKFVAEYNYKGLWFSNRVEIDGIPFIGANGKGVSNEYAKASALGEFMERLQSGFLLNNLFTNKINQINNQYKCNDDWISCVLQQVYHLAILLMKHFVKGFVRYLKDMLLGIFIMEIIMNNYFVI